MEDFTSKRTVAAENFINRPGVVGNDDDKVLNRVENSSHYNDENDINGSTVTITTLMSNLSVDSPVFIPSVNGATDSVKNDLAEEKNNNIHGE
jgi:hypothetical protein